jgi:general L-amino acid transport system substrate-binding protein
MISAKTTRWLSAGLVAGLAALAAAPAQAQSTVDTIKSRGNLLCGVSPSSAGFAFADDQGVRRGFDVDICRAVAAAILGDGDAVEFVPLNTNVRFQALQSGEIDILSRQTTNTFSRENSLGLDFGPTVVFDGQGLMVTKALGVDSAEDLDGAAICLLPGTTTLQNLNDYFGPRGIEYEAVVFENTDEWRNAFFSGRCDAITSDRTDVASVRAVANNPDDYVVLPETISKEPLAPVVRQGDSTFRDIVSWTVYALFAAEEHGITSENLDEHMESEDPEIQRMLGVTGDLGEMFGLDNAWAANAIRAVGNYGEIWERNLGENTRLGLTRGQNRQWTEGGLLYAPPFR